MTRKEAIEQFQNCIELIKQDGKDWLDDRDIPVLNMTIEALTQDSSQDLISRQDVEVRVNEYFSNKSYTEKMLKDDIKSLPSADVVEVIRCKDCKYWKEGKCWNLKGLNKTDGIVNVDDFCAYGERREP